MFRCVALVDGILWNLLFGCLRCDCVGWSNDFRFTSMGYEAWVEKGIPEKLDIRADEWAKHHGHKIVVTDLSGTPLELVQAYNIHEFTVKRYKVDSNKRIITNLIGDFQLHTDAMSFYVSWQPNHRPKEWNEGRY